MKVTLNIKEDAELRNYIKDMIKGQVKSVMREEIINTLHEELTRHLKGTGLLKFENLLKEEMRSIVKYELNLYSRDSNFIKNTAKDEVNRIIREAFHKGYIIV